MAKKTAKNSKRTASAARSARSSRSAGSASSNSATPAKALPAKRSGAKKTAASTAKSSPATKAAGAKKTAAKKASAGKTTSKKAAAGKTVSKKASKQVKPKAAAKTSPKKTKAIAGPKKAAAKKATSKRAASTKAASNKATSKKATPKKGTSSKATSKKATSKKAAPKKAVSKKAVSKKAAAKSTDVSSSRSRSTPAATASAVRPPAKAAKVAPGATREARPAAGRRGGKPTNGTVTRKAGTSENAKGGEAARKSLSGSAVDSSSRFSSSAFTFDFGPKIDGNAPPAREDEAEAPAVARKKGRNAAGLSAKELRELRALLVLKRAELLGDVSSMEAEALRTDGGNLANLTEHMADRGTDNYEQEFTLDLVQKDRELLAEIDHALSKIDGKADRPFGICEGTGRPIKKTRLEAQPWTRYSIDHARKLERSGR